MRFTILVALILASVAVAQDTSNIDDIVVTASRTEQKLDDSPVATELVSRKDLANSGAEDVAQYLQKHPGIHIVPSTFGTRIHMQGLDSKYIIVLVDGEKIIGRKYGIMDLSRFTTDNVERIEIVKGNMSALYGSEAIGGVINIITRKAKGRKISLHARGAEGSQYDGAVSASDIGANWNARVSADWHSAEAFDLDSTDDWTSGNSNDQYSVAGKVDVQVNDGFSITTRSEYMHKRTTGVDVSGSAILDRRNTTDTYTTGMTGHWKQPGYANTTARLSYSNYRDQFVYDQRGSNAMDEYQDTRQKLGLVGLQHDRYVMDNHYLSVGLESSYEQMESSRLNGGEGDRTRSSIYLQDEWEIGSNNLFVLLPGVRIDDDSQFGNHISPKLSFRHDPTEKITVRGSYGSGFRAPDFKEMYLLFEHPGVGYRIVGNPDLEPETSLSSSVGVEYQPTQNLWFSVSGYRHDVEGLIQAELEPIEDDAIYHWLGVYRNVSEAMLQGFDLSARWSPLKIMTLNAGYSYLDAEDKELNEPLEGRARHRANGSVSVHISEWNFSLRGTWVGERPFTVEGTGYGTDMADSYVLADTRISRRFNKNSLFCGVSNLLDEGDNDYLPVRPRAVFAGMDLTF